MQQSSRVNFRPIQAQDQWQWWHECPIINNHIKYFTCDWLSVAVTRHGYAHYFECKNEDSSVTRPVSTYTQLHIVLSDPTVYWRYWTACCKNTYHNMHRLGTLALSVKIHFQRWVTGMITYLLVIMVTPVDGLEHLPEQKFKAFYDIQQ